MAGVSRLYPQSSNATDSAFRNSNKQLQAMTGEEATLDDNLAELRRTGVSLGNRPLVILTSEETNEIDFVRPLQADFLNRSSQSRQMIVEDSGHNIHNSQPEAVIAAIREIVEAAGLEQSRAHGAAGQ